jgi:hypothetical protein
MTTEGWHRMLQITGAALGVPAAAVGTFAAYQNYFSTDVTCQKLRNDIIGIMERNVAPETKRSLLKKDVMEFDKLCGEGDPDARTIFQAAMAEHPAEAAHATTEAGVSPQRPQWASLGVLARRAPRSATAGWPSAAVNRGSGCQLSWDMRSRRRRCRRPARSCRRKPCCRCGLSRSLARTIRARCTAGCRPAPACACWPRAAEPVDCGPRSHRPRAREQI